MGRARLEFCRVALAIGVPQANVDARVLLGDLLIVAGGSLWATTDADRQDDGADQGARRKRPRLSGGALDPDFGAGGLDIRRNHPPCAQPLSLALLAYQAFWVVGLTFLLWFVLVKTYSASKIVGLHLHHAAVRRGGRVFYPARHADDRLRRRGVAG